jgi:hypothetical protein
MRVVMLTSSATAYFMKLSAALCVALFVVTATMSRAGAEQPPAGEPQLDAENRLSFPADYREWIFLSAGLGMNYGPNARPADQPQSFTNVYVNPASYRAFMKTGKWPDRTTFVLEIRGSTSEGSINRSGHYQTDVQAIEVNLKDQRVPGGWGFYDFGRKTSAVAPLPQSASCYSCHRDNTAVEHTFVQFYPSLMAVARRLGTVKPEYREGTVR